MVRLAIALCLFLPTLAAAQTEIACSSGCPARRYFERTVTASCPGLVCTRAVPVAADFGGGTKGLGLSAMKGATLTLCAEEGYLLDGTGSVRFWQWVPWPTALAPTVSTTRALDRLVSAATSGTECTGGTACRCVHWEDLPTGGPAQSANRRVIAQPISVGVTAAGGADGTPTVEAYLVGLE